LKVDLLVGHDHIDIIRRVEAVGHGAEKAVRVGWEVDADDRWGFVHDDIQEARILMCEPIVIYDMVSWLAGFMSTHVQL
jgi:hypothetical protein